MMMESLVISVVQYRHLANEIKQHSNLRTLRLLYGLTNAQQYISPYNEAYTLYYIQNILTNAT